MAKKPGNKSNTLILGTGAILIVLVAGLFVFGGGNNNGQPSAPSGPGNPMQTDQGR